MVPPLPTAFNVVFGNKYIVTPIFIWHAQKKRFSSKSQNFIKENLFFGQIDVILLNLQYFSSAGVVISDSAFRMKFFNGKLSSVAGLTEILFLFFPGSTVFGQPRRSSSNFKVIFFNVHANFRSILGQLPGRGC